MASPKTTPNVVLPRAALDYGANEEQVFRNAVEQELLDTKDGLRRAEKLDTIQSSSATTRRVFLLMGS
jgi:hypothetical protein